MNKLLWSGFVAGFAGLQIFLAGIACSQDIVVTGGNARNVIPNGSTGDPLANTYFGEVAVSGGLKDHFFNIYNVDRDTPLIITGAGITGANAGDFTIVQPPGTPVPANSSVFFAIRFNPTAAGSRTAILTVASNDPDAGQAAYTFDLTGTGLDIEPAPKPDLRVSAVPSSFKSKLNKASNTAFVKGKLVAETGNGVASEGAVIKVYSSDDLFFDPTDTFLTDIPVGPLAEHDPAKEVLVSLKVNLDAGRTTGYLFFRVVPAPSSDAEADFANNVLSRQFGVTEP